MVYEATVGTSCLAFISEIWHAYCELFYVSDRSISRVRSIIKIKHNGAIGRLFLTNSGFVKVAINAVTLALCYFDISVPFLCLFSWVIITHESEVIMFFTLCVCVCLSVYVYHDVCPEDLTMKDRCHTNNILQVHCWACLVVQVMFHTLMASLTASRDHKIGQILKLIYLRQYLNYSVDRNLKMSEISLYIHV